jgi:hypothetical protein
MANQRRRVEKLPVSALHTLHTEILSSHLNTNRHRRLADYSADSQ